MANAPNIGSLARDFAQVVQDLLNGTVCDQAHVTAVSNDSVGAFVGTYIDKFLFQSSPTRLRSTSRIPLWLDVGCHLGLDEHEGRFLTVESSFYGISVGPEDARKPVLHYDFARGKSKYTEAHVQVYGRHPELEAYAVDVGAKDWLAKYHLPVGGRRFRPCVEDVIEFLIAEDLVRPKADWDKILERERKQYRVKQIAAVVRKNPGTAIRELERLGYRMAPPEDPTLIEKIRYLAKPRPRIAKDEDVVTTKSRKGRRKH